VTHLTGLQTLVYIPSKLKILKMWKDLGTALALLLVMEGILPFLNPIQMRQTLLKAANMTDAQLRILGGLFMALGLLLLYTVH